MSGPSARSVPLDSDRLGNQSDCAIYVGSITCHIIQSVLLEDFACDFRWEWNVPRASHQNGALFTSSFRWHMLSSRIHWKAVAHILGRDYIHDQWSSSIPEFKWYLRKPAKNSKRLIIELSQFTATSCEENV